MAMVVVVQQIVNIIEALLKLIFDYLGLEWFDITLSYSIHVLKSLIQSSLLCLFTQFDSVIEKVDLSLLKFLVTHLQVWLRSLEYLTQVLVLEFLNTSDVHIVVSVILSEYLLIVNSDPFHQLLV